MVGVKDLLDRDTGKKTENHVETGDHNTIPENGRMLLLMVKIFIGIETAEEPWERDVKDPVMIVEHDIPTIRVAYKTIVSVSIEDGLKRLALLPVHQDTL